MNRAAKVFLLVLLFAVCGAASLPPGHVCAQETTASDALEEVVVTAERRSSDIQTTSVSVTAISGAELLDKHINVIADLETQVPGLSVTSLSNLPNGPERVR